GGASLKGAQRLSPTRESGAECPNRDTQYPRRFIVLWGMGAARTGRYGSASARAVREASPLPRCLFHKSTASRQVGATLVVARGWAGTRPAPTGAGLTKWTSRLDEIGMLEGEV